MQRKSRKNHTYKKRCKRKLTKTFRNSKNRKCICKCKKCCNTKKGCRVIGG